MFYSNEELFLQGEGRYLWPATPTPSTTTVTVSEAETKNGGGKREKELFVATHDSFSDCSGAKTKTEPRPPLKFCTDASPDSQVSQMNFIFSRIRDVLYLSLTLLNNACSHRSHLTVKQVKYQGTKYNRGKSWPLSRSMS